MLSKVCSLVQGKNNMKALLFVSPISMLLFGCSPSMPGCGDLETTGLVLQIATEELHKSFVWRNAETNKPEYTAVTTIITKERNEKTGALSCEARLLKSFGTQLTQEVQIAYTVERTDDGELYVTVYGI